MKTFSIPIVIALLLASGCVTGSPDQLLSADPRGEAQKSGQFPVIGRIPVGQTTQMTATERAELQSELARDAQSGQQQAQGNSTSDYQREVNALKRLAKQREDALRQRIEGEGGN